MMCLLAYAESGDQSLSNIQLILWECLAIGGIAVAAFVPMVIGMRRRCRSARTIAAFALLWGFLSAGSAMVTINDHVQWEKQETQMLMSGYYNPVTDQHSPPNLPWPLWVILGAAYAGLIFWGARGRMESEAVPDDAGHNNGDGQTGQQI